MSFSANDRAGLCNVERASARSAGQQLEAPFENGLKPVLRYTARMRIAVLASPDSWYFRDLVRAAGADHELLCLPFSEIQSRVDRKGQVRVTTAGCELTEFDAVLVRTMPPGSLE